MTVSLNNTCFSSNPDATLVYFVDGEQRTTATCPEPDKTVTVTVKPLFTATPDCPYEAKTAYTLKSERPALAPGATQSTLPRWRPPSACV
jgi:hypothetical protein